MKNSIKAEYYRWLALANEDDDLVHELKNFNEAQIEDAFFKDLSFGTGGLRGVIGAGTNRMNIYTVARASQGLANYLNLKYKNPSAVIGYDSRIKSDDFARVCAEVFAANKIKVYIWKQLMPVSTVSFATIYLNACAGVMITASHNPAKYNGYKVYGDDGCQITIEAANQIFFQIQKTDTFSDIKRSNFDEALKSGTIRYIDDSVYDAFVEEVLGQSVLFDEEIKRDFPIVYTPLNGTGLKPILSVAAKSGFSNITVVKEQELPNGNFPTCPYPNPEIKSALDLGIDYAWKIDAELILATDPDCDRVGIAVKDKEKYVLLSGNEVGVLLLDYICSQRIKHNRMPENPIMIKTIVTSDLGNRIAEKYGVRTIDVLTGFKFIGEQISLLEKNGKESSFVFGFEESYGYLSGTYVRDKDGVGAALLICEMLASYKTLGVTLLDRLNEIYSEFGYYLNTLHSFDFDGCSGFKKMQDIMHKMRDVTDQLGSLKVERIIDYEKGINGLPKSDVLKFVLPSNCVATVRPSGTEPKIKVYISACAENSDKAKKTEKEILDVIKKCFD